MPRLIEIPFGKLVAVGNDFVVVRAEKLHPRTRGSVRIRLERGAAGTWLDASALARSICQRQSGIGADGLLLLLPPADAKHHARMLVFNADGSEAEMSGNGIRCAAGYLLARGRSARSARSPKAARRSAFPRTLQIETAAGIKSLRAVKAGDSRWVFRVAMGQPVLAPEKISFNGAAAPPVVDFPLSIPSGAVQVTVTSMGNPHCSVFVDNFESLDWPALGCEIERHDFFPKRTNVEFVKVLSKREIEVRYWERGVGRTQSSGTGSCAAVVACILNGLTERKVRVRTLAGTLEVAWPKNRQVTLTGPVELTALGTYLYRA